jgi:hypothetical protein
VKKILVTAWLILMLALGVVAGLSKPAEAAPSQGYVPYGCTASYRGSQVGILVYCGTAASGNAYYAKVRCDDGRYYYGVARWQGSSNSQAYCRQYAGAPTMHVRDFWAVTYTA